jgi:transposase
MLYKNAIVKRARVWAVPERRLKIIELHKEGYNNKQISEIMGIKTDIVSTGIYLARRDKLLPPPEKAPPLQISGTSAKEAGA